MKICERASKTVAVGFLSIFSKQVRGLLLLIFCAIRRTVAIKVKMQNGSLKSFGGITQQTLWKKFRNLVKIL